MSPEDISLYRKLFTIRRFEETLLENFHTGIFFGTTHTYIGQEANAVGVLSHLQEEDIIFSNHRCHGHFLAADGDPHALFAELMGRSTGVCGGRGGSQHLQWKNFYSNGVQGGIVPVAVGMALAEKFKRNRAAVIVFMGDGTLGEGVVYEALNMASLWGAPVLFVLENNRIAQTTPIEFAAAGNIPMRFSAFGIHANEVNSSDVDEILAAAGEMLKEVRSLSAPRALILNTFRFGPHSKGDDTRSPEEIANLRRLHDPITIKGKRMETSLREVIENDVNVLIATAYLAAQMDPFPTPGGRIDARV